MKKTTLISIRLPNSLLDDLRLVRVKFPSLTLTQIICLATAKDISRYL